MITAAEVEVTKAMNSGLSSYFAGYLSGIRAGAGTFGSATFDTIESEARSVPGQFGHGFRDGLMNVDIVSA